MRSSGTACGRSPPRPAASCRCAAATGATITASYPELGPLAAVLARHRAILDGEIVAFAADGRPSFERLQERMHVTRPPPRPSVRPHAGGLRDLRPARARRRVTARAALRRPPPAAGGAGAARRAWQTPEAHLGDGAGAAGGQRRAGPGGHRGQAPRQPLRAGPAPGAWVKVKNARRQEFVVGGWMPGQGGRAASIGALLIGYHDAGELRYAGRVGSGLGARALGELARAAGAARARALALRRRGRRCRAAPASWLPRSSWRCASASGRPPACCATRSTPACATTSTRAP